MPTPGSASEETWQAPGNLELPCRHWSGELPVTFEVVAIHGLAGSAGDFGPLAERIVAMGGRCFAPNLRGQGSDPRRRQRGHFRSPRQWADDLNAYVRHLRAGHGFSGPLFLVGESLGGVFLTVACARGWLDFEVAGLILLAPVPFVQMRLSGRQQAVARWLIRCFPRLRLSPGLFTSKRPDDSGRPAAVCRDPEHLARMSEAPHRIKRFSLRFLGNVWELLETCPQVAPRVREPVLHLCAGNDLFVGAEESRRFFELLGSADKAYHCWPEAYHLLLHDPVTPEVLETMEHWLRARLRGSG